MVSSITLGIALRYVLEALRKDPEQGGINEKMFRFGMISLEQFRSRLPEWPQYCTHILQIAHLGRHCPELFAEAQRAINNPTPQQGEGVGGMETVSQMSMMEQLPAQPSTRLNAVTSSLVSQMEGMSFGSSDMADSVTTHSNQRQSALPTVAGMGASPLLQAIQQGSAVSSSYPAPLPLPPGSLGQSVSTTGHTEVVGGSVDKDSVVVDDAGPHSGPHSVPSTTEMALGTVGSAEIDRMGVVNVDNMNATVPPEAVRDQIQFIVNNIAKSNIESKSTELKGLLSEEYFYWFANYLVVKRISTQPNLHVLYLMMLDTILSDSLSKALLDSVFHNVTKLLQSTNITTSSSERSLLRNLGSWLGQVTLARSKPLLARRINLKELLFWGYESGRLIAVCSFVAKILEGIRDSKVFRPPNPWITAILGVLRELFELEDLKMNIKFEVQVLCKNVNIKIEDIPRTFVLTKRRTPFKEQNPDFNVKLGAVSSMSPQMISRDASLMPMQMQMQMQPGIHDTQSDKAGGVESEPSFAPYVQVSQSVRFFAKFPAHRRLVAIAIDRAIREMIQPVVERSVTIACVTTKQLVLKDYALEPNESQLRNAAHLMISDLAGSLAYVTCKEPLRISIGNHLKSLLAQVTNDQTAIDEVVQVCSNENLDLGCILIEKAATEKAIRDIDESLASSIQARRKHRETGQPFVDSSDILKGSRYPRELPEMLKPKAGGLYPQQALVYEGFQRQRPSLQPFSTTQQHESSVLPTMQLQQTQQTQQQPVQATLSMSQALEACQKLLGRVEVALSLFIQQAQAQGREITLSMLKADNEIITTILDMIAVIQRTYPTVRLESAMTFAERVFKR